MDRRRVTVGLTDDYPDVDTAYIDVRQIRRRRADSTKTAETLSVLDRIIKQKNKIVQSKYSGYEGLAGAGYMWKFHNVYVYQYT